MARTIHLDRVAEQIQRAGRQASRPARGWRGLAAIALAAALGIAGGLVVFDRILMPSLVGLRDETRIPAVGGRELEAATRMLRDAGLEPIMLEGRFHPAVPPGRVLEISPPVGLSVKKGRQVAVTPSLGAFHRAVPDLAGQPLRMARLIAGDAGLRLGSIVYAATDQSAGEQILAMSPDAGEPAPADGAIRLLVSRSRPASPSWMPDLRGRPAWRCEALLARSGFRPTVETGFGGEAGTVVEQEPAPGAPLWPRTPVRLTVAPGRAIDSGRGSW